MFSGGGGRILHRIAEAAQRLESEFRVFILVVGGGFEARRDLFVALFAGGAGEISYRANEKLVAATHAKAALVPTPEWLARDPRSEPGRKILNAHKIPCFAGWEYPELDLATDGTVCWLIPKSPKNP